MATKLDTSSLLFALLSKCSLLTQTHLAFSLLVASMACLAVSLFTGLIPEDPHGENTSSIAVTKPP
ncbi:hypothetical protein Bca52824_080073 [Brassica carinata]|uniref:Uncharacterized protein n=1 Tax=Brassica carinata TaxID=52824 RepID=A0A8X7PYM6_BRACI|nr:hypothetical protein Bca52824_080073 [Brassica carinata]